MAFYAEIDSFFTKAGNFGRQDKLQLLVFHIFNFGTDSNRF